jgi:hypothetical protein
VEFEIAYRGDIVDVVLEHGEIRTENEEIRQFVIKEVLPYLPHWIGWRRYKNNVKKGDYNC